MTTDEMKEYIRILTMGEVAMKLAQTHIDMLNKRIQLLEAEIERLKNGH